jgi:hypothetical protein
MFFQGTVCFGTFSYLKFFRLLDRKDEVREKQRRNVKILLLFATEKLRSGSASEPRIQNAG